MFIPVLYISSLIHIFSIDYMSEDPAKYFGKILMWEKLSNSGDLLKLMVLNYIRKIISGWINHSGKVISHKMSENKMEYRGSKSKFESKFVKEQRVDGSWCIINHVMRLRYTLMNFERNYPLKIPSKQLNVRKFSTNNYISPLFWSGLIDAEGSFNINIDRRITRWRLQSKFQMGLHKRNLYLLKQLQHFLGGIGSIYVYPTSNKVNYSIDSKKDLTNLIIHLE